MLPEVSRDLEAHRGWKSFFYGNFNGNKTLWTSYPADPRYGTNLMGVRGHLALLSEAYTYAPYKDRVLATRDFVRALLDHAAAHKGKLKELHKAARQAPKPGTPIALRTEARPLPGKVKVLGDGPGDERRAYELTWINDQAGTLFAGIPEAYAVPADAAEAIAALKRHGLAVEELREDVEVAGGRERITALAHDERPFQGHRLARVETAPDPGPVALKAGTLIVRTGQPRGLLAALLLEPRSEDGLLAWNAFDALLKVGEPAPVIRLDNIPPFLTSPAEPLPESEKARAEVGSSGGGEPDSFGFRATWLPDGDHYLQSRGGGSMVTEAATGRMKPVQDSKAMARALASIPTITEEEAERVARQGDYTLDPKREAALVNLADDLYYARMDGSSAERLTSTPEPEELASFSPDGRFVAFVRGQDLWAIDLRTRAERSLTTDGGGAVRNGRASYIYYEEVFDRNPRAYWWAPDSRRIAFLRFDDAPVRRLPVFDALSYQVSEQPPWPRAGDANPLVKLGIADVSGSPAWYADLSDYTEGSYLIMRAYWQPDGGALFAYVQDRSQTWLDVLEWSGREKPARKLRETTKAWVETLEAPHWLENGSFLLLSERAGWRHLDRYKADGTREAAITSGEWAIRSVVRVDEAAGWAYFTARKDQLLATDFYRARLDGSTVERLTPERGNHSVNMSPNGRWFIDRWSSRDEPPRAVLRDADGKLARTLDSNPLRAAARLGRPMREPVSIPTADGFALPGEVIEPKGLDLSKKYPVFVTTYGGPRAPTIADEWGLDPDDKALSDAGFLVFRVDPRSATDRGAISAWAAYKQLGVRELKDIEEALKWLLEARPHADKARVGIRGSSYGGFLTTFALTHSDMFAAGVAEAPVTDWRDYDTIYTERYMGTPQENPDGYRDTSAVRAAGKLRGKLLLIHGGRDHNVPIHNTMKLVDALQRANKDFELMIYPTAEHGGWGQHGGRLAIDFLKRTLGGPR
jgi:dipeptidyl-peptidase-4